MKRGRERSTATGPDEGKRRSSQKQALEAETGKNTELTDPETEKQKQNVETQPDSLKRFNESESMSSDLTPEEQLEKPRKLDKLQRDKIAEYKRLGGSYREIANYMGLSPSTVYRAWKNFPDTILPKDSPGPSKLVQAPVVPLDNNGKEKSTTVVVTQEVTEPKAPIGGQCSSPGFPTDQQR